MKISMNSSTTRMKKMVSRVVNAVPTKQLKIEIEIHGRNSLLITPDQPLSVIKNNHHHEHQYHNQRIPKGYVAVYVGPHHRRFVIPTRFLSVPDFKAVMDSAAEEFGYEPKGGLRIPNCDEHDFQELLAHCSKYATISKSKSLAYIHAIIPLHT